MDRSRVFAMKFAGIYDAYIAKAEKKERTKAEVDEIIFWLTGYDEHSLGRQLEEGADLGTFLEQAPQFNPNSHLITGKVCGISVEDIEDDLTQKMRYLDKLIDELAKGRPMEKILRSDS